MCVFACKQRETERELELWVLDLEQWSPVQSDFLFWEGHYGYGGDFGPSSGKQDRNFAVDGRRGRKIGGRGSRANWARLEYSRDLNGFVDQ